MVRSQQSALGVQIVGFVCVLFLSSDAASEEKFLTFILQDGVRLRPDVIAGSRMLQRTGVCRLRSETESHEQSDNKMKPRRQPFVNKATTFVETLGCGSGKSLVEIGCTNAKREFVVDQHLLGLLPERAENRETLGSITLVGAGPGDPDLLTVAAVKAIQAADLVVADRLVSQEILSTVKCELKVAQKHPGCAIQAQNEIYRWCESSSLHTLPLQPRALSARFCTVLYTFMTQDSALAPFGGPSAGRPPPTPPHSPTACLPGRGSRPAPAAAAAGASRPRSPAGGSWGSRSATVSSWEARR